MPKITPHLWFDKEAVEAAGFRKLDNLCAITDVNALGQSRPTMLTQRRSISAVCGYSSLSIMFLSAVSAISLAPNGGIHVVTNVARFSRAAPSSSSSLLSSS